MKLISTICAVFMSGVLFAQKAPFKFGDVSMEELKMKYYPGDSSAAAVVLADFGESSITYNQGKGFELRFKRSRRVKILNKDGYDWATLVIPIYKNNNISEKFGSLKAVTINLEDGKAKETKLEKSGIFTEDVNERWEQVKLTMPAVKEGSIIDITYQVTSPYWFNFQDWEFQSKVPTVWSEYVAYIPEYFEYQRFVQGYIGLNVSDVVTNRKTITINTKERHEGFGSAPTTFNSHSFDYTENVFKWSASDVPAFKEEPFMTTFKDYISRINFELAVIKMPGEPIKAVMGTWENINKEYLDSEQFGGVVKKSAFLSGITEQVTAGKVSDGEKTAAIFSHVRNSIEWDGTYRVITDGNFKKVLDEKRGSSAEINLMLVAMLKKANVNSDPVLISTRDHGSIRQQFAISSQFNYVLASAVIDGKRILLDATDRTLPMLLLPKRCLNGSGFVVSESNSGWVELAPAVKTRSVFESNFEFGDEGLLNGKISMIKEGYDGQELRGNIAQHGEELFIKKLTELSDWTVHTSAIENKDNLSEPVKVSYELSLGEDLNSSSDILYIDPLFGNGLKENPFKSETRAYPVNFGSPFESTHVIKLKIPEGFKVEEIPAPVALALPGGGGRFIYSIGNADGMVSLTSQLVISRSLFAQTEYPVLREFYSTMIAKQQEQLVLKKIAE